MILERREGIVRVIFIHIELIQDRKSTRLNSSHDQISYAVFCLKKKKKRDTQSTARIGNVYVILTCLHVFVALANNGLFVLYVLLYRFYEYADRTHVCRVATLTY